jgi:hypothetical protein
MMSLKIGTESLERKTRRFFQLSVAKMADGSESRIPVHILNGAKKGPTLCLLSAIHGDEIFPMDVVREIVERTDLEKLSGTIIAVPVANPHSFESGTRNTPFDFSNLNRIFPGKSDGSLSERIAHVISQQVMRKADYLIDLHSGPASLNVNYTYVYEFAGDIGKESEEIAAVFGQEILYKSAPIAGTALEFALRNNVVAFTVEIGSPEFRCEEHLKIGVRGVENVMKHLDMISGKPVLPKKQCMIKDKLVWRPTHGGLLCPVYGGLETQGEVVAGGTTLARIISPYTFEELERVKAPYEETLLIMVRARSRIFPGDDSYQFGNMKTARWIRR